jgi:RND family efflux transporter MFP subunit
VQASESARFDGPTVLAVERALPVEVEVLGTVRPRRDAVVAARVLGVVTTVEVEEGDRVAAGELLVRVEAEELGARAEAARREVQAAEARLAQARRDLERTRALEAKEAATAVELEHAETGVELAEAQLAAARQAAAGERSVASHLAIRAPFDGRVLERLVDPGDLAAPGTPLLKLEAEGGTRLEAPVDERLAAGLAVGDRVSVRLDAGTRVFAGVLGEIEPAADPDSRTLLAKIDLPEGTAAPSGAFGRAVLVTGERPAVVVDAAAVRRLGGLSTLRVVEENRLVIRHVRTGRELPSGGIEILSGLAAGERVATGGRP